MRAVVAQQVGQANVNGSKLRELAIPIPPREEIEHAVTAIRDAFSAARSLALRLLAGMSGVARTEAAALAKAFRGELVPQDPNDEPADKLLERIRAARAAEPQPSRRGRGKANGNEPATPTKPAAARPTTTEATEPEPIELVVAAFQNGAPRLKAADIADTTGLDRAAVKAALDTLVAAGQVRIEGKARGTTYVWTA